MWRKYGKTKIVFGAVGVILGASRVDIDDRDDKGFTPLWHVVRQNHVEAVRLLVVTGEADINWVAGNSMTPSRLAVVESRVEIVELMLETGKVDLTSKVPDGGQENLFRKMWDLYQQDYEAWQKRLRRPVEQERYYALNSPWSYPSDCFL
jgi:ankyrin repeat protein